MTICPTLRLFFANFLLCPPPPRRCARDARRNDSTASAREATMQVRFRPTATPPRSGLEAPSASTPARPVPAPLPRSTQANVCFTYLDDRVARGGPPGILCMAQADRAGLGGGKPQRRSPPPPDLSQKREFVASTCGSSHPLGSWRGGLAARPAIHLSPHGVNRASSIVAAVSTMASRTACSPHQPQGQRHVWSRSPLVWKERSPAAPPSVGDAPFESARLLVVAREE